MSFSTVVVAGAKEDLIVSIPAEGEAVGANADPEVHITNSAAPKLYEIIVDCEDNPNEDVTVRLYDTDGTGASPDPEVGVDGAHVWVPGIRGRKIPYAWPIGIPFTAGISVATVKGDGGTGGSGNPTGTVRVTVKVAA